MEKLKNVSPQYADAVNYMYKKTKSADFEICAHVSGRTNNK